MPNRDQCRQVWSFEAPVNLWTHKSTASCEVSRPEISLMLQRLANQSSASVLQTFHLFSCRVSSGSFVRSRSSLSIHWSDPMTRSMATRCRSLRLVHHISATLHIKTFLCRGRTSIKHCHRVVVHCVLGSRVKEIVEKHLDPSIHSPTTSNPAQA